MIFKSIFVDKPKKNIAIGLILTLAVVIMIIAASTNKLLTLRTISLAEQKISDQHELILTVFKPTDTAGEVDFYRLSDAKPEHFTGKWTIRPIGNKEIALFGSSTSTANLQRLAIVGAKKGAYYEIGKLPGMIKDISANPNVDYLLINGQRADKPEKNYLCVTKKSDQIINNCINIVDLVKSTDKKIIQAKSNEPVKIYHAYWSNEKETALIVREFVSSTISRAWNYNLPSQKLRAITDFNSLPDGYLVPEPAPIEYDLKRYGLVWQATNKKTGNKTYFYSLNKTDFAYPLIGPYALFRQKDGAIWVINITQKQKSLFTNIETDTFIGPAFPIEPVR